MAVVVCPWCQNEIPQEEGAEPDKWCPVCENELSGYRTLQFGLDDLDEEDEEAEEDAARAGERDPIGPADAEWTEKDESLLRYEEAVERLLDDQDVVPECLNCREYMLEAGEMKVAAAGFAPRVPASLGEAVLQAPFALTLYVCPSCFTVQQTLADDGRQDLAIRLSRASDS